MNKENKQMRIGNSAVEYLAPRVKVVKMKARRVMCTSPMEEQAFGLCNDGELGDGGDL